MPLVPNYNLFMAPALPGKLPRQANGFNILSLAICAVGLTDPPIGEPLDTKLVKPRWIHKSPFGCPSPPPNFRRSFIGFHGIACLPFKRSFKMTAWKLMASESHPERCKIGRLAYTRARYDNAQPYIGVRAYPPSHDERQLRTNRGRQARG
jgi:hypothetical protein